jgi:polyhydroxybutyrate depolymerase
VQGAERQYELILPPSYSPDGEPWPLVFALHPNEATDPIGYWHGQNLPGSVNDRAVLVITASLPQGNMHNWNTAENEAANLAYFDTLLEELSANLCIDEARVFSMGFSGGGSFSSVLGCLRGDRFRGFASSGGILYFELTSQNAPCVGEPGAWVNIGTGEVNDDRLQMREFWRESNGCDLGEPAGPNQNDNPPCVTYTCDQQPMTHCSHDGGHEWPAFGNEEALEFLFGLE